MKNFLKIGLLAQALILFASGLLTVIRLEGPTAQIKTRTITIFNKNNTYKKLREYLSKENVKVSEQQNVLPLLVVKASGTASLTNPTDITIKPGESATILQNPFDKNFHFTEITQQDTWGPLPAGSQPLPSGTSITRLIIYTLSLDPIQYTNNPKNITVNVDGKDQKGEGWELKNKGTVEEQKLTIINTNSDKTLKFQLMEEDKLIDWGAIKAKEQFTRNLLESVDFSKPPYSSSFKMRITELPFGAYYDLTLDLSKPVYASVNVGGGKEQTGEGWELKKKGLAGKALTIINSGRQLRFAQMDTGGKVIKDLGGLKANEQFTWDLAQYSSPFKMRITELPAGAIYDLTLDLSKPIYASVNVGKGDQKGEGWELKKGLGKWLTIINKQGKRIAFHLKEENLAGWGGPTSGETNPSDCYTLDLNKYPASSFTMHINTINKGTAYNLILLNLSKPTYDVVVAIEGKDQKGDGFELKKTGDEVAPGYCYYSCQGLMSDGSCVGAPMDDCSV